MEHVLGWLMCQPSHVIQTRHEHVKRWFSFREQPSLVRMTAILQQRCDKARKLGMHLMVLLWVTAQKIQQDIMI